MKNIFGFSLRAAAILGAVLAPVRATEPPRQPSPEQKVSAPAPVVTGRVLVLENERTLTGDIERVGDRYRIKRLVGETWVPAGQVLKLCADLEEAYRFLLSRTNRDDPDERLRIAEWCRQHGMRDQALVEARAAVALEPRNDRAKRLVGYLQEAKAASTAPPVEEKLLPRVDVTAESLNLFASRVQPILMNACASCHTAGRGGNFQLTRAYTVSGGSRRSLDQNLAAAMAHVNTREPRLSRLLTKAVSIHGPGMATAPLRGRQAIAYRTLENWVMETLADNPQLRESLPPPSASASASPVLMMPPPPVRSATNWGDDRVPSPAPAAKAPEKPAPTAASATPDPVDAEAFNREFHPQGKGETPR
jgi:hypothetical protein